MIIFWIQKKTTWTYFTPKQILEEKKNKAILNPKAAFFNDQDSKALTTTNKQLTLHKIRFKKIWSISTYHNNGEGGLSIELVYFQSSHQLRNNSVLDHSSLGGWYWSLLVQNFYWNVSASLLAELRLFRCTFLLAEKYNCWLVTWEQTVRE